MFQDLWRVVQGRYICRIWREYIGSLMGSWLGLIKGNGIYLKISKWKLFMSSMIKLRFNGGNFNLQFHKINYTQFTIELLKLSLKLH